MNTVTRTEAIKQIEAAHGEKVHHILIPQVEGNRYYRDETGMRTKTIDGPLEYYMDSKGVELGYKSDVSAKAAIFPNKRKWADSHKIGSKVVYL